MVCSSEMLEDEVMGCKPEWEVTILWDGFEGTGEILAT